jgi:hypothetical protein
MANKPYVVGIDPGNERSAFCLVSPDLKPLAFGKHKNILTRAEMTAEQLELLEHGMSDDVWAFHELEWVPGRVEWFYGMILYAIDMNGPLHDENINFVIEDIENFGMPAGRSLFDTAKYIGRLSRMIEERFLVEPAYIFRHEEKMTICHNPRANDATIKRALVDRFAPNTPNYGKGSKKQKGFFYGFSADVWSSFAIAVTYHDKYLSDDLHLEDLPF